MIEAGACAIQIENQVSDEKQCGHQDGKVTVPHEDFLAKIRACRYAFLELGVEDGIIVARTDSLGAGLTKQIAVTHEPGDLGDQYNAFLDCEDIESADDIANGDVVIKPTASCCARSACPPACSSFKRRAPAKTACVLDCITSLQNGADLLWIETEKPHVGQIAGMVNEIREGRAERQARLQQLAVLQLDAELPPAGLRCLEARGQGRLRLRPRAS
jgi:isocitrate lyase